MSFEFLERAVPISFSSHFLHSLKRGVLAVTLSTRTFPRRHCIVYHAGLFLMIYDEQFDRFVPPPVNMYNEEIMRF